MSLTHVMTEVPHSAMEKLFNQGMFDDTSDTDLTHTSMAYELRLTRQDDRGPNAKNIIPRISVRYLKDLYAKVKANYCPKSCIRISELYTVGLGLPLDKRLAAFWNCYAYGSKPEYGGNEVQYSDLLYTLKEHIRRSIAKSPDGYCVYQTAVQKHFDRFSSKFVVNNTNIETAIKQYGSKKVFAGPNLDGRDTVLVYKQQGVKAGGYRLYAAFIDRDADGKNLIPFLKQAANCNSIPKVLDSDSMPNVGTFVVVLGKTVLTAKTVKELAEHRAEQSDTDLFNAWFDQDMFSHADSIRGYTPEEFEAVKFLNSKRQTISKAQVLVKKVDRLTKKGQRVKRSNQDKYTRAKAFLNQVAGFEKTVNKRKEIEKAWRKHADIGKYAEFYAFDMLIDESVKGTRFVRVAFMNMQRQFKRMGISPVPMVEVKVGSTKTLPDRALSEVKKVKGVKHTGVIIRACDNKTVNQSLDKLWYSF